jgi:hypothetical protein
MNPNRLQFGHSISAPLPSMPKHSIVDLKKISWTYLRMTFCCDCWAMIYRMMFVERRCEKANYGKTIDWSLRKGVPRGRRSFGGYRVGESEIVDTSSAIRGPLRMVSLKSVNDAEEMLFSARKNKRGGWISYIRPRYEEGLS